MTRRVTVDEEALNRLLGYANGVAKALLDTGIVTITASSLKEHVEAVRKSIREEGK